MKRPEGATDEFLKDAIGLLKVAQQFKDYKEEYQAINSALDKVCQNALLMVLKEIKKENE